MTYAVGDLVRILKMPNDTVINSFPDSRYYKGHVLKVKEVGTYAGVPAIVAGVEGKRIWTYTVDCVEPFIWKAGDKFRFLADVEPVYTILEIGPVDGGVSVMYGPHQQTGWLSSLTNCIFLPPMGEGEAPPSVLKKKPIRVINVERN